MKNYRKEINMENEITTQELLASKQSNFVWTSGSDVQKVWKRYGWKPPTEYRNDYMFKKNRDVIKIAPAG
jgi:hypothetical protein